MEAQSSGRRAKGLLIALAGVLAVSPDAMLLRSMRAEGASVYDTAAVKYLGILLLFLWLALQSRKARAAAAEAPLHFLAAAGGQLGATQPPCTVAVGNSLSRWACPHCHHHSATTLLCCRAALLPHYSAGTTSYRPDRCADPSRTANQLCFTFSMILADPAKALLLISLTPLWAAVLGRLFLGDALPWRTVVALGLSMISVALVFVPRALEYLHGSGDAEHGTLTGDVLAITAGFAQAVVLCVNRHAALSGATRRGAPTMLATGLSSALACAVAIGLPCDASERTALGETPSFWACTPHVWASAAFLLYGALDAACVAGSYVAATLASRHITSPELALILLLEDVLGPLGVYLRFGVVPSAWTVGGGALLLFTLAAHEVASRVDAIVPSSNFSSPSLCAPTHDDDQVYVELPPEPGSR